MNGSTQNVGGVKVNNTYKKFITGPSLFGELMIGLPKKFSLVLRGEMMEAINQKFETIDGEEKTLTLLNVSLGIRTLF